MINSRDINELVEPARILCTRFVQGCADIGIDVIIICTYRDNEAQDALYASGRTTKGAILTYKRGGESEHNKRRAFDFAPLKHGKIDWQDTESFRRCGVVAEALGLTWGGRWKGKLRDLDHCELK